MIRVALFGLGKMGLSHQSIINAHPDAELVAVCDTAQYLLDGLAKFTSVKTYSNHRQLLAAEKLDAVFVATPSRLHAEIVEAALDANLHVFCEKPLCLDEIDLAEIVHAYAGRMPGRDPLLMVGFNRRFAPMAVKMKAFLKPIQEPLALHYRINAGFVARDHWVNDPEQGGGRVLGEVGVLLDGRIEIGDVGLVMLIVVQLHCGFVNVGLESGVVVR